MEGFLHEVIGKELRRRHGIGMMEGKLRPVHVANALMRSEHGTTGRMSDIKMLMTATASKELSEARLAATKAMLDASRDRWGRLGEEKDLRRSALVARVLPLLRTILASDGAAFGTSPEQSSFSSPTALTVTGDPSDDHAGEFVHRLWSGSGGAERLVLLDLLKEASAADRDLSIVDDLTAVLAPLSDELKPWRKREWVYEDLTPGRPSGMAASLRAAAADLGTYERHARPNPIATLQRIVTLASMSIFFHAVSRAAEWTGSQRRLLLLDASGSKAGPVASASETLVTRLMDDSRTYMASVLADLLIGYGLLGRTIRPTRSPNWRARMAARRTSLMAKSSSKLWMRSQTWAEAWASTCRRNLWNASTAAADAALMAFCAYLASAAAYSILSRRTLVSAWFQRIGLWRC